MTRLRCAYCRQAFPKSPLLDRMPRYRQIKLADLTQVISHIYASGWSMTAKWHHRVDWGQIHVYCPRCRGRARYSAKPEITVKEISCRSCYRRYKLKSAMNVSLSRETQSLEYILETMKRIRETVSLTGNYQFMLDNSILFRWKCQSCIDREEQRNA